MGPRASSGDEEVRAKYRRRLTDVKDRGYAISVVFADSPFTYEDVKAAMREYAAGGLTPARERAVRAVFSQASPFFETVDIDDGETHGLGSIVVPVLGPDGNAVMVLRARQLPRACRVPLRGSGWRRCGPLPHRWPTNWAANHTPAMRPTSTPSPATT